MLNNKMNHNIYTVTQKFNGKKRPKKNMAKLVYDVNENLSKTDYNICLGTKCFKYKIHHMMNNKWTMYETLVQHLGKQVTDSIVPETTLLKEYMKKDEISYPFYLKHPGKARKKGVYYIQNYDDVKPYIKKSRYVCQKSVISDSILGYPYNLRLYIFITRQKAYLLKMES
jgi:hypothetical protein